mmetsp:Transcript_54579/g.108354  ORF Transcript_54579/g.108354 Transcript_54579/m.108354 type:complete len:85 (+) Transcript_54579:237-491(+)
MAALSTLVALSTLAAQSISYLIAIPMIICMACATAAIIVAFLAIVDCCTQESRCSGDEEWPIHPEKGTAKKRKPKSVVRHCLSA